MSYYRTQRHRDYDSSELEGRVSGEPVSLHDKDRDADFPLLLVMRHDGQPTRSVAGAVAQIVDSAPAESSSSARTAPPLPGRLSAVSSSSSVY